MRGARLRDELVPAWKATWKATWQAHLETHLISLPTTLRSLITDYAAPSTVEAMTARSETETNTCVASLTGDDSSDYEEEYI